MLALRLLLIVTAASLAFFGLAYLFTGNRRYLAWALRTAKYGGAAALIFFGVLFLERLA